MVGTIVALIILSITVLTIRSITVFIHELGHAIPALLLAKGKIDVYIGSYGDPEKSLILKLGRFKIFFKYNPFLWSQGLCSYTDLKFSPFLSAFIITLGGPLFSLLFGVLTCLYIYSYSDDPKMMFLGVLILISSLLDFYVNIVPDKHPIRLFNGDLVFNDGAQIKQLLRYRTYAEEYIIANKHFNNKEFEIAAEFYLDLVNKGIKDHSIFQLAISSLLNHKAYQQAISVFEKEKEHYTLDWIDYYHAGIAYSQSDRGKESVEYYTKSIELNINNPHALNNRGFQYNLLGAYQKAIADFDKVIEIDQDHAYALNNRGHAKIELGMEEEGLKDIEDSIQLDDQNSYTYRNYGIYYLKKGQKEKALKDFQKAYDLDPDTYEILELIKQAKTQ